VTLRKYFSHPNLVFFPISSIKLDLRLQIGEKLLIINLLTNCCGGQLEIKSNN
jgi:hypothetical protein